MKKRTRSVYSLALICALLLTITPISSAAAGAEESTNFSAAGSRITPTRELPALELAEEFALMVDERPDEDLVTRELERLEASFPDGVPDELLPDPDEGKTERFIVKYATGREESFKLKVGSQLDESLSIEAAFSDSSTVVRNVAPSRRISIDLERPPAISFAEYEVITLEEAVWPSEFAEELQRAGAAADIEYIQPDFELNLESLGLELVPAQPTLKLEISEESNDESGAFEEPEEDEGPEEANEPAESARTVNVAVIDAGMDTEHEVFEGYLHEAAAGNGSDSLQYAHGTHIGGIIANTAYETGADVRILPIDVFTNGTAYTSDIIAAIVYATEMGADIINCSFGSTNYNQALYDAIAASDALFVCAVGNARRDFDETPSYPAGYDLPNIVSVASVNADDGFSYFSNYGSESIDIAAEGREVYSSLPGNEYGTMTGTSMSAAQVTGAAAAVLSVEELGTAELKQRLISSADVLDNLLNKVADGRRLNLMNAILDEPGESLSPDCEDDFDVHGYQRTDDENWQLFSSLEIIQVATGDNFSLALASDGTVWAWGQRGALGNGFILGSVIPIQVPGLTNIVSIAAGGGHGFAIRSDGVVWAWGNNHVGQLGNGTTVNSLTAIQIAGLTDIVQIDCGDGKSLAVDSSGDVWVFGFTYYGGTGTNCTTPVQVSELTGIVSVAAGAGHELALDSSGNIWAWGYNYYGQLGNGASTTSSIPIRISGLSNVAAIDAGDSHSLAIASNGDVWSWGRNNYGQLGIGTTADSAVPVKVTGVANIVSIAAGYCHSVAVDSSGNVRSWGYNVQGQLGNGAWKNSTTPIQISTLTNISLIAAGMYHCVAVDSSGGVWTWGFNFDGQLGDGTKTTSSLPILISIGAEPGVNPYIEVEPVLSQIAAGSYHTLFVNQNGTVWAWGSGSYGQLGNGTTTYSPVPVQIPTLSDIVSVAAGEDFSLALDENGSVWAWGKNNYGQLGNGTVTSSSIPVQVAGLTNIVSIVSGINHVLALDSRGNVWTWGYNDNGQLGDATTDLSTTPVKVAGLPNIITIAAGHRHSLAVDSDGNVWGWGENSFGQLGLGPIGTDPCAPPIKSSWLSDIVSITAGINYSMAIDSAGDVWAWGYHNFYTYNRLPVKVTSLTGCTSIVTWYDHSLAIDSSGNVRAWGSNNYGQLGNGTTTNSNSPIQISGLTDIVSVSVGRFHSIAVDSTGSVWTWGYNFNGQLGDGTSSTPRDTPVLVINGNTQSGGGGLSIDVTNGETVSIALTAEDVTSFNNKTIAVSYNAARLELLDIAAQVYGVYMAAGAIPGTGITVTSVSPGEIKLTLDLDIPAGQFWSGTITVLHFEALATGSADVSGRMTS